MPVRMPVERNTMGVGSTRSCLVADGGRLRQGPAVALRSDGGGRVRERVRGGGQVRPRRVRAGPTRHPGPGRRRIWSTLQSLGSKRPGSCRDRRQLDLGRGRITTRSVVAVGCGCCICERPASLQSRRRPTLSRDGPSSPLARRSLHQTCTTVATRRLCIFSRSMLLHSSL